MATVDAFGNACDRAVRIHIRQIHNVDFDILQVVRSAQQLFGKYRIQLLVVSMQDVRMRVRDLARLSKIETQCYLGQSAGEQAELYSRFGVQDLSSITAFLVQSLTPLSKFDEKAGCAAHAPHRPAVFISRLAGPWTLAHELGHVLLGNFKLIHRETHCNLMRSGYDTYSTLMDPHLDADQLLQIRNSPHLLPC